MPHGAYLVGASTLFRLTLGVTSADAYWCTSDIGWIVGHSLMVYGALANRARVILREGSPDYPNTAVVYDVIARKRVTWFYTAPTLARMLMRFGPAAARAHDLSSLQAIFCAGEPLNPEAWHLLNDVVSAGRVPVSTSGGKRNSPHLPSASCRRIASIPNGAGALVSHPACGEAGAIGIPDEIKGEPIVAYVVLRAGQTASPELARELIAHVRIELGPIATPQHVEIVAKLPKTRSGKIMRRVLRVQHLGIDLGDLTTLDE